MAPGCCRGESRSVLCDGDGAFGDLWNEKLNDRRPSRRFSRGCSTVRLISPPPDEDAAMEARGGDEEGRAVVEAARLVALEKDAEGGKAGDEARAVEEERESGTTEKAGLQGLFVRQPDHAALPSEQCMHGTQSERRWLRGHEGGGPLKTRMLGFLIDAPYCCSSPHLPTVDL
eukprot:CAMPEP_0184673236 /NCGR_PEP_ID=MMETSP0308-20130426/86567_1 /TAXON_ID=38269 /ORGANISM="Gloeochaete witrockiana, Strain SAG 46.84" /LENGTH=172 /DNA_ID=CAMNT_0027120701 /DNA_START=462 /DNA_END=981 /DNA_ORIENTATION=+